jgi:hypothetical protein
MAGSTSPLVHHLKTGRAITCGVPVDRRDPTSASWRDVNCSACLEIGFVEVRVGEWRVSAPEAKAESVLLVLEGVAALIARGKPARELRPAVRRLLVQHLEARLPDDPATARLRLRRFRARPGT